MKTLALKTSIAVFVAVALLCLASARDRRDDNLEF